MNGDSFQDGDPSRLGGLQHTGTAVRQRRPASDGTSSTAINQNGRPLLGRSRAKSQFEGSLLYEIGNDVWRMLKLILRLPGTLYPYWKWLLVGYFIWLAVSYLTVALCRFAFNTYAPLCSIQPIGPWLPLCSDFLKMEDRPIDTSKLAKSQDELLVVMNHVGQNYDLARDMIGHEFAVRDLRIRIAASDLRRKRELTKELESLIHHTKDTAKQVT